MQRPVDGVVGPESSRTQQQVWETGVGCADDDNCILRVKEVDSLYRGEAPKQTTPVESEPRSVREKSKKKRKQREEQQGLWKKKIHRTRTAAGEEEETITLNLRKADTIIDVSIKSPVKRKSKSRQMTSVTKATLSTERQSTSSMQDTSSSGMGIQHVKSCKTKPISNACATVLLGDVGE